MARLLGRSGLIRCHACERLILERTLSRDDHDLLSGLEHEVDASIREHISVSAAGRGRHDMPWLFCYVVHIAVSLQQISHPRNSERGQSEFCGSGAPSQSWAAASVALQGNGSKTSTREASLVLECASSAAKPSLLLQPREKLTDAGTCGRKKWARQ